MKTTKSLWTIAVLLSATMLPRASAVTIETFSFTQTGYAGANNVSGTFTGTVEPDGSIQQADLSFFSATYTAYLGQPEGTQTNSYSLQNLQLFSFMPSADGPNSSLDIFAHTLSGTAGSVCVGAAAAFGLCGQSPQANNAVGVVHLIYAPNPFLLDVSKTFAVVTYVQPTLTSGTPEPATMALCGLALVAAGLWRRGACLRLAQAGRPAPQRFH